MNDGTLIFEDPAGELSPQIPCSQFAASPLGKAAAMHLEGLRTRFHFRACRIAGEPFTGDVFFEKERLTQVEMSLKLPHDVRGWDGWSEAGERERKSRSEAWLARVYKSEPQIVPFEVDGTLITPFEKSWDLPCHIQAPWGTATSFYDSKSGFGYVRITYTPNPQ